MQSLVLLTLIKIRKPICKILNFNFRDKNFVLTAVANLRALFPGRCKGGYGVWVIFFLVIFFLLFFIIHSFHFFSLRWCTIVHILFFSFITFFTIVLILVLLINGFHLLLTFVLLLSTRTNHLSLITLLTNFIL